MSALKFHTSNLKILPTLVPVGTSEVKEKEEKGRAQLSKWGVDTSDIEQGSWGRIRQMLKREAEARGEEMPKF